MTLRSLIEYGTFAVDKGWWNEVINKWKTLDRKAQAWCLGLTDKTNKNITIFESDMPELIERVDHLRRSYIAGIHRKVIGLDHKKELEEALLGNFTKELIDEVEKEFKEYNEVRREIDRKRKEKNKRPSKFITELSFTKFICFKGNDQRREERFNKIKEGGKPSDEWYIKYVIKNVEEAKQTSLIHRDFKYINRARAYYNLSAEKGPRRINNGGPSTVSQAIKDKKLLSFVNGRISEIRSITRLKSGSW